MELNATSLISAVEYAYPKYGVHIYHSEIIRISEQAFLGIAKPLLSTDIVSDGTEEPSRNVQTALLLSSREIVPVKESIRYFIGISLKCVSSADVLSIIDIQSGDAFWPVTDIVLPFTKAECIGKGINPFVLHSPIPDIAKIAETFLYKWGGILPDDWNYPDLQEAGLTFPILKLPILNLAFKRIKPLQERPILDRVWNISQNEARLSASFIDFDLSKLEEQGFIIWHYDKENDLISNIQKISVTEFREYWARTVKGLHRNTDYYAVAFVTTSDNLFIASTPEAFTTRKSPKLFDLVTPYMKLEDLQLGSDLQEFLEILQITIDQQEANISEALQYKSVNDIPERFLQNLADNIGGQLDQYLTTEENRTSLKEFMPLMSVKGSQTSFDIIFNKLQMACEIVNNATKIIIPSYQGRLSYEDAHVMDQFYWHEGALDINISWFGKHGQTSYPVYDRIYEELEKVWPAGFLLYLTVKIALTTTNWEAWLDIESTVQRSKNFTWRQETWLTGVGLGGDGEESEDGDNSGKITHFLQLTKYLSSQHDFAYRFSNNLLDAGSRYYNLLSRNDAFSRKPIRINHNGEPEREHANHGEPIQYRPSIKRYIEKTRYSDEDFQEYWLPDYSLDTDNNAYVEQTKGLPPLIWAQTYFRSHCFMGYDWEMTYEYDVLKAVNLHIGVMPALTQHIIENEALKPVDVEKYALARIGMGNLPILGTLLTVQDIPVIPFVIKMEKPSMAIGNLPVLTKIEFQSGVPVENQGSSGEEKEI